MKVLVCWHGAVEPVYRRLFDEIAGLGVQVRLIAPAGWREGGKFQNFSPDSRNYDSVVLRTAFTNHIRVFFYPNVLRIFREISGFKPDIIHVMEEPFSLAAYEMLKLKKLSMSSARTILFSFENIDIPQRFPFSLFQSYNMKNADAVIVVPEESVALWKERGFGKKISRIPLGIDTGLYRKMDRLRASRMLNIKADGAFKAGYAGRIVEEKGLFTVLASLKELIGRGKAFDFYLAGDGEHKTAFLKRAKELGVEGNIHLLGALGPELLPAFYNSMDALILPSVTTERWKEQFGRVIVESMACGTPVIGSSSGEIPNVIGRSGLVFPEGDAGELAGRLEALMSDASLKEELIRKGLEKASQEYSWRTIAREYVKLYGELGGKDPHQKRVGKSATARGTAGR